MADNVTVTSTASYIVASDYLSASQNVQYVKLMDGTNNSESVIPGGSAQGLLVDVSRIQAGSVTVVAPVNASGHVQIDLATRLDSTNDSITVINTTASLMSISGQTAHDSAATGNPVRMGLYAVSGSVADVAHGDAVNAVAALDGKQVVMLYACPECLVSGLSVDVSASTSASVIAAPGANWTTYLTQITLTNSSSTNTWVNIQSGSVAKYTVYCAASGGGAAMTFSTPLSMNANEAVNVQCETTGANVRCSAAGYKAA
jgi:hypothetical protein